MNLWESISIALEGLAANKMRSILTMLGVVIGVAAVITMLALAGGAKARMMNQIKQMGTNVLTVMANRSRRGGITGSSGSRQSLTLSDAEAIADQCSSVVGVAPEVSSNAQIKYRNQNTNTSVLGTTSDYPSVRNYRIREGEFFTDRDVRAVRKLAVIGPTTAENLFGGSSPVGKAISIQGTRFTVIGVTAEKGMAGGFRDPDDQIIIPVTTAMRRMFGLEYVRAINVQAAGMELMEQAEMEITALLRKRHRLADNTEDDFIIRSQAEIIDMANETSGVFTLLLGGIASVSLLVGGIGIMNIMLVSVTERTREIGIRIAVGARGRDIQIQFLVEAMVLSMLGGIVGILLGMLGAFLIKSFSTIAASVSMASIILSFGFAALVGIFFGFYPARTASRLDPIEALRYE